MHYVAIVGSNSKTSLNRRLAAAIAGLFGSHQNTTIQFLAY